MTGPVAKQTRGDGGMTLIELVVAMAIFALVAIMGLQGLSGMLRIRDRLTEVDQNTASLSRAVALLRNDLTSILPMRFFPPGGPAAPALDQSTDATVFALSIAGQPDIGGDPDAGGIYRAQWRVDPETETLFRQVWTTLTPADTQALQPETQVMQGVLGLRVRSHWGDQGWIDGPANPFLQNAPPANLQDEDMVGGAPEVYSDFVPSGVEVTLVTAEHGDITLIEAIQ